MYCISVFVQLSDGKAAETELATNLYRELLSEDTCLPTVALRVACAGSCWKLVVTVMPSGTLGKDLMEPAAMKSLYFAERHCLALGKLFAECPMVGSRQISVRLRCVGRLAFAENNSWQRLCRGVLALCRMFLALGVCGDSSTVSHKADNERSHILHTERQCHLRSIFCYALPIWWTERVLADGSRLRKHYLLV